MGANYRTAKSSTVGKINRTRGFAKVDFVNGLVSTFKVNAGIGVIRVLDEELAATDEWIQFHRTDGRSVIMTRDGGLELGPHYFPSTTPIVLSVGLSLAFVREEPVKIGRGRRVTMPRFVMAWTMADEVRSLRSQFERQQSTRRYVGA